MDNSEINGLNRFISNGEMKVDDEEDELLDNSPISPDLLKKNFNAPFGVGGNEAALPPIFKPKLDPKMLVAPTAANKFPRPNQDIVGKFEEAGPDMAVEELDSPDGHDTKKALFEAEAISEAVSRSTKKKIKKKKKKTGWQN